MQPKNSIKKFGIEFEEVFYYIGIRKITSSIGG